MTQVSFFKPFYIKDMIFEELKELEVVEVTTLEEVSGGAADFTDPFGRYLF